MRRLACVATMAIWATAAGAQSRDCISVFLPDLAVSEGAQSADIPTGYPVPPYWTQPAGAFYPVSLYYGKDRSVYITQTVGQSWARERWMVGVSSVSLVSWTHVFDPWFQGVLTLRGYKTLPNTAPASVLPTWAYRRTHYEDTPTISRSMSEPMQPGETYNFSVRNALDEMIWIEQAQVQAMVCR